jgi:hypothetical protein
MKQTIHKSQFVADMKINFSIEGCRALFEYLEETESQLTNGDCCHACGNEFEMSYDPVSFRCDFSEYENLKEIKENYSDIKTLNDLRDRTTVIEIPNSNRLIIENF